MNNQKLNAEMKKRNLWSLQKGESAVVESIETGEFDSKVSGRLSDLGFAVGGKVRCVDRLPFAGPRCFLTSRGEFALDQPLAESILVR